MHPMQDSNPRPPACNLGAIPAELTEPTVPPIMLLTKDMPACNIYGIRQIPIFIKCYFLIIFTFIFSILFLTALTLSLIHSINLHTAYKKLVNNICTKMADIEMDFIPRSLLMATRSRVFVNPENFGSVNVVAIILFNSAPTLVCRSLNTCMHESTYGHLY